MPGSEAERYSSKIIKAGALLSDTRLLLANWDESATVAENLARVRRENLFGKSSRSRIEDILIIFQQRYLRDPQLLAALVTLTRFVGHTRRNPLLPGRAVGFVAA